jgi:hypothetical protein
LRTLADRDGPAKDLNFGTGAPEVGVVELAVEGSGVEGDARRPGIEHKVTGADGARRIGG